VYDYGAKGDYGYFTSRAYTNKELAISEARSSTLNGNKHLGTYKIEIEV